MKQNYPVIVIGGGHAGIEAALSSARKGVPTLMVTMDPSKIGEMPCNPSIGGVGKGQLVKEIDALGGEMGKAADYTAIQFRRLNTRKGSAVQSSRCQSDKPLYAQYMQKIVSECPNLTVLAGEAKQIITKNGKVEALRLVDAKNPTETLEIPTKAVVLTAGTFMSAVMHCGNDLKSGGRVGEKSSVGLSEDLKELGFKLLRLKTGTPARLKAETIDFSVMNEQKGDEIPALFSFSPTKVSLPQISCYLGFTNQSTHAVIADNLEKSPLYSGRIKGIGPRYCPSIEDKVVKFPDKPRHQVFFEPVALNSNWIYPNGISTSLPASVQEAFVRTIEGCEKAEFARFGYAVEYDCVDPTQLDYGFQSKEILGLFFGGQVNGTSGYEEAAAQGLIAGVNAALYATEKAPFHLSRAESYIGVLIDDLISTGITEPYRMFTSRAEFRLSLREDNADLRLRAFGKELGLVNESDWKRFEERKEDISRFTKEIKQFFIKPTPNINEKLKSWGTSPLSGSERLSQLVKRPELSLKQVKELSKDVFHVEHSPKNEETIEIELKFEGYIELQRQQIEKLSKLQHTKIPIDLDFEAIGGLSIEARQKFQENRPTTLAEAAKIPGITPASITSLLVGIRKGTTSGRSSQTI